MDGTDNAFWLQMKTYHNSFSLSRSAKISNIFLILYENIFWGTKMIAVNELNLVIQSCNRYIKVG